MDITVFEQGGQLPGNYWVDVFLNGDAVDTRDMEFYQEMDAEGEPVLKTCLTRSQLTGYGIKVDDFSALFPDGNKEDECARLAAIPQATEEFRFNSQQLLLSVPQVALVTKRRGIAPLSLWDDGEPVFLMNYQTNVSRSVSHGAGKHISDMLFARLDPGINLGAWRFRNMTTYQKYGNMPGTWQTGDIWAERGLYNLKSRLTLGEHYTPSDIFNSVPFRGGMLGSDDMMVPYTQRDFSPVVQGIARTQARVDVRQGGRLVYSTTVAPGTFELTDLPAGNNGDLLVIVAETDGDPQVFTVPWSTPAVALRKGYLKYNLMAGQYNPDDQGAQTATVAQVTSMYGLPAGLTVYGGIQWAEHYQGASMGMGMLLGTLGALSVDGTVGQGRLPAGKQIQGQTWRLRYNKTLDATKTGISLSSIQYSPSGEVSLGQVLGQWSENSQAEWRNRYHNAGQRKTRYTIGISQPLFDWGNINLTGFRESYRSGESRNKISASFSSVTRGVYWSLNWTRRKVLLYGNEHPHRYRHDLEASLWLSIPLDRWFGGGTNATWQTQLTRNGMARHETGLNGNGFNQQLHWSVGQQLIPGTDNRRCNGGRMNLSWNGGYGIVDGGYSYDADSRLMNIGLSGGVVVHQHGVTMGQPLGRTTALIAAPGASDVRVSGGSGISTDFQGYTTLTGLTPYQGNTIELDPSSLPAEVELPRTGIRAIPTEGAVIPVRFPTRIGKRALFSLRRAGGDIVPFGAVVSLVSDRQQSVGISDGDGKVYMSGLPEKGNLEVRWGEKQHCLVEYTLPEKAGPAGLYSIRGLCR